ncbi:tRNA-specific 2-thiouridylase MnmA [Stieleria neptunia]|uniref:tRNA-specific 2-thiouridylase MnmA n=1 Tax=Stieleria neptunia TaxID=2527979 RepID=A0A518HWY4_9BACT|nr:ATP-dependent sacrificial sulfur transferase LarE [Stieleria neptunia]QDV45353.1 tRNA-specific 2-thiouridylase MnmA [Stieleria neptunia]
MTTDPSSPLPVDLPVDRSPVESSPADRSPSPASSSRPAARAQSELIRWFDGRGEIAVAFSGGVDSSVVLAAALRSTAPAVTAVTAVSPSVATWQLELAQSIATHLGATHRLIETHEVELPEYRVNDASRCFHCKSTLYQTLHQLCQSPTLRDATIVSGTNADDLGDYRPGIAAGDQAGVLKPLAELKIDKAAVREIAHRFGLPNASLPASPCLASRIAYGVPVTVERLQRVEKAEDLLRELGFETVRVRYHDGDLARIEVPADQIARLTDAPIRTELSKHFSEIGFRYITLDLQGFSSGSMNRQLVSLGQPIGSGK